MNATLELYIIHYRRTTEPCLMASTSIHIGHLTLSFYFQLLVLRDVVFNQSFHQERSFAWDAIFVSN